MMFLDYKIIKGEASKHFTQSRFHNFRYLLQYIDDMYDTEQIEKLYARRLFSDTEGQTEFILFFDDKIVKASDKKGLVSLIEYRSKINHKQINIINDGECTLNIQFENGQELYFNSVEDTTGEYLKSYVIDIKELYKYL